MAAWYNLTVTSHQFLYSFGSRQCPLKSIHWTVLTKELLTWQFFIGRKWWMAIQHRRENHIEGELIESLNHHRTLSLRLWLNSTFINILSFQVSVTDFYKKKSLPGFVLKKCVTDLITYRQTAWDSILYVNGILWEIYDHVLSHQSAKHSPKIWLTCHTM